MIIWNVFISCESAGSDVVKNGPVHVKKGGADERVRRWYFKAWGGGGGGWEW